MSRPLLVALIGVSALGCRTKSDGLVFEPPVNPVRSDASVMSPGSGIDTPSGGNTSGQVPDARPAAPDASMQQPPAMPPSSSPPPSNPPPTVPPSPPTTTPADAGAAMPPSTPPETPPTLPPSIITIRAKELRAGTVRARVIYAKEIWADNGRIEKINQNADENRWEGQGQDGTIEQAEVVADTIYVKELRCTNIEAVEAFAKTVRIGGGP